MEKLLKPIEVDELLRYTAGHTRQLIKQGKIRYITLPDGKIRIPESVIRDIVCIHTKARGAGR
jgi:predicted site-specific integrase-resolvase